MIAKRYYTGDSTTGGESHKPRRHELANRDKDRREDVAPLRASHEKYKHDAPQKRDCDMQHEARNHQVCAGGRHRSMEQRRADRGERQRDTAGPMTHGDQRAGRRGRRHAAYGDDRRSGLRWHDCKASRASCWTQVGKVAYLEPVMHEVPPPATILVVEDNPELVALLRRVLGDEGFKVRSARDGESGLASALDNQPDLLILDVGLPKRNGLEVIQELRRKGVNAPTLMLTARAQVADRVTGLDAGADDYLVKPFDTDELVARVRALLRRSAARGHVPELRVGDLVLDPVTREVHRGGREIILTHREFELLDYMMRHARTPVSRAELASQVWRQTSADIEETNIVDVYVAYLRKKLDAEQEEPMLRTLRGIGYVLRPPSDDV